MNALIHRSAQNRFIGRTKHRHVRLHSANQPAVSAARSGCEFN
jgi:hypothetical protein